MTLRLKTNILILRFEREKELKDIYIKKKRRKLYIHCKIEQEKDTVRQKEFIIREEIREDSINKLKYLKDNKIKGRTKLSKEILNKKKTLIILSKEREADSLNKLRITAKNEKSKIDSEEYDIGKDIRNSIKLKIKLLRNESTIKVLYI